MAQQDDIDKIFPTRCLNIFLFAFILLIIASFFSKLFLDDFVFSYLSQKPRVAHDSFRAFPLLGKTIVPIWLLCFWFISTSRIKGITIAILALVLVFPAVFTIKSVVRRPRPRDIMSQEWKEETRNNPFRSWSFPSGDTASIFAVAAAVSCFMSWYWRPAIFTAAAIVGIMRITSFGHYPSDVFTGAGVGFLCAWLAVKIARKKIKFDDLPIELLRKIAIACLIIIPVVIWHSQANYKFVLFINSYVLPSILFCLISKIENMVNHRDSVSMSENK